MIKSAQQDNVLLGVKRWMDQGGEGVRRLFGYAGTGKTTLAKLFADGLDGVTTYCAYTGKAAHVLAQKGCEGATTIHKLIYKPADRNKTVLMDLKKALEDIEADLNAKGVPAERYNEDVQWRQVNDKLEAEKREHKRPAFSLNLDSAVKDAKLLVVDECSMVDDRVGRDLETFGVPILVLGDPFQLPPVKGSGYFTSQRPDWLLTEVHRQARDSPVLRLATDVREGRSLHPGQYGTSKVITRDQVDRQDVMDADQILVGRNLTRNNTNFRCRQLLGFDNPLPMQGDRLVCLRNNHEIGILNGSLWKVRESTSVDDATVELCLDAEDSDNSVTLTSHAHYFRGEEPPFWHIKDHECFDYGNAMTVHKSQGSQWPYVYVFDESRVFRQDAPKHLYTAITRAADQVTVVLEE